MCARSHADVVPLADTVVIDADGCDDAADFNDGLLLGVKRSSRICDANGHEKLIEFRLVKGSEWRCRTEAVNRVSRKSTLASLESRRSSGDLLSAYLIN
jgi:hypothetical protein